MKLLALTLGVVAVVSIANVQEKVGHDQCVFCANEAKIKTVFKDAQYRQQIVRIDDGVMYVTLGRNETDGKAIQEIYRGMASSFASKQAKSAECCAEKLKALQQASLEVAPSKRGAMLIATSNNAEVVAKLQALAPDPARSGTTSAVTPAPGSPESPMGTPKEESLLVFLGKGDGKETCPVQGTAVNKNVSLAFKGHTIYFCCAGCKGAFEKNPEKYVSTK
jgi:YHS domain-containing protein